MGARETFARNRLGPDPAGNITSTTPGVPVPDAATMPGCRAAAGAGAYWTASLVSTTMVAENASAEPNCAGCAAPNATAHCCADPTDPTMLPACFTSKCGDVPASTAGGVSVLQIDAASGSVVGNATFPPGAAAPPAFAAWDDATGLAYSVIPFTYSDLGLYELNYHNATAKQLKTYPKQPTDGVGSCEGRVVVLDGSRHFAAWLVRKRVAATPRPRRGYFAGDESRRRRGRDVDICRGRRVAATPRPRRGYAAGDNAWPTTWISR